jgi:hypothetical protein
MAHQPQPPEAGEPDRAAGAKPDPGLLPGNQPGPPRALPRRRPGATDPAAFQYVSGPIAADRGFGLVAMVSRIARLLGRRSGGVEQR